MIDIAQSVLIGALAITVIFQGLTLRLLRKMDAIQGKRITELSWRTRDSAKAEGGANG